MKIPVAFRASCAAIFLLGACAQSPAPDAADPAAGPVAAFPVTIEAANGAIAIESEPVRIVSLSPSSTEMLFAIDAGDQVAAVDDQSNFPPEAPTTKLSSFEPNAEAVIGYEPDLVIASADGGGLSKALKAVDVPFLVQPAAVTIEDTYSQIEQLGKATGHTEEAATLIESMRSDIEAAVADIPEVEGAPTYYHELDDTYFSVTSKTFIGQIYSLMGLKNIADGAKGAGSGYPQLSAEYIVDADPDLIFLADTKCCGQTAETVAKRPGWDSISAVRNDVVVELDDDIASRWGPRIVEFVELVADRVATLGSTK